MIYLTDRTTITTDQECGEKRRWYKEEGGKGIVPLKEPIYYAQGSQLHHDLASSLLGVSIDGILTSIEWPSEATFEVKEPISRRIGMIMAFDKWVKPILLKDREVVMVEKELILDRSPLQIACTADAVLGEPDRADLECLDFKSVAILGKGWFDHWRYAIQLHINMAAIEEELGRPCRRARIIGWFKGKEEGALLRHPYVYGYSDGLNGWSGDWKRDWTLRPVWEYNGASPIESIRNWVDLLGEEVALNQFPFSAPVGFDPRLLDICVHERTEREREIALGVARFEHSFERCRPTIGAVCPYLEACHNASIEADPIGSGLYVPRTPHHEVELIHE